MEEQMTVNIAKHKSMQTEMTRAIQSANDIVMQVTQCKAAELRRAWWKERLVHLELPQLEGAFSGVQDMQQIISQQEVIQQEVYQG